MISINVVLFLILSFCVANHKGREEEEGKNPNSGEKNGMKSP